MPKGGFYSSGTDLGIRCEAYTEAIDNATASVGEFFKLTNASTGAGEWAAVTITGVTTATVSTTDATQTTCGTIATTTDTAYLIKATIIGRNTTDSSQSFGYVRTATFQNDGGTVSLVGAVTTDHDGESVGTADATLDFSGTNIRCRVTGVAATNIDWSVSLESFEV